MNPDYSNFIEVGRDVHGVLGESKLFTEVKASEKRPYPTRKSNFKAFHQCPFVVSTSEEPTVL